MIKELRRRAILDRVRVKSGAPEFIITVDTTQPGSASDTMQLPIRGTDMTIDWGDGNISTGISQTATPSSSNWITHSYAVGGTYQIKITGLDWIYFNNKGDKAKLMELNNFGTGVWASMERSFFGCLNMIGTFTDVPDLSNVTNMNFMFRGATSFNGDISSWNVSNVTGMLYMLGFTSSFNSDISNWDVSNVTNMLAMFHSATSFNVDISNWNVSNVTNMGFMLFNASSFNQDLSSWCVTNITSPPTLFDSGAASWVLPRPVWGTCP